MREVTNRFMPPSNTRRRLGQGGGCTLLRFRSKSTSLCVIIRTLAVVEQLAEGKSVHRRRVRTYSNADMDQETITTEAPGIDSGADTNAGILTEADLASSFLERVEEQPEEKPSETEATEQTSETVGAEAEEDSEGNVLSQSEQSEETETAEQETSSLDRSCDSAGVRRRGEM